MVAREYVGDETYVGDEMIDALCAFARGRQSTQALTGGPGQAAAFRAPHRDEPDA
jgi:hypothetical protein